MLLREALNPIAMLTVRTPYRLPFASVGSRQLLVAIKAAISARGQSRRPGGVPDTSDLSRSSDISRKLARFYSKELILRPIVEMVLTRLRSRDNGGGTSVSGLFRTQEGVQSVLQDSIRRRDDRREFPLPSFQAFHARHAVEIRPEKSDRLFPQEHG